MKKLNQKGFTHHLLIIGIAVVVVAAIGFTGWRVYQGKNNVKAKANGYQLLTTKYKNWGANLAGKLTWVACKVPYGTGYAVKLVPYGGYSLTTGGYPKSAFHVSVQWDPKSQTYWKPNPLQSGLNTAPLVFGVTSTGSFGAEFYATNAAGTNVGVFETAWTSVSSITQICN